jgi:hypothetical protein
MKKIAIICLLFINGCVIVVDETEEEERVHYHDHYVEGEVEGCSEPPYEHRAEWCEVYDNRECCEWYTGDGCYEYRCFYYDDDNCNWHYYGEHCEEAE